MCFPFTWFKKKYERIQDFSKPFDCSCEICGANFTTMRELIVHMGYHTTESLNRNLKHGYGTVRCNTCYQSFSSVADMYDHPCSTIISGLSPIQSYDSLDSVAIHS